MKSYGALISVAPDETVSFNTLLQNSRVLL